MTGAGSATTQLRLLALDHPQTPRARAVHDRTEGDHPAGVDEWLERPKEMGDVVLLVPEGDETDVGDRPERQHDRHQQQTECDHGDEEPALKAVGQGMVGRRALE